MENIFLFASTLLAFFVKAITGFANTLVLGSLGSFVIANRLITPVDLIFGLPTNVYMAWRERKNISLKMVIPLSLMVSIGIVPGALLLKAGSDWILKAILGIVIVGLAVEMWTRNPSENEEKKNNYVFLIIIGVISGVLVGLYGIGALLVSYISRTTDNKNQFRANICCVFLVDNVFRFFLYFFTGILNKEALLLALLLSPAVMIGMIIGVKVDSYIKEETLNKLVIALLMINGITLFLKSLIYH